MKGSLGVRLALGETQVVTETRKFLTDNGVALDCFSQVGFTYDISLHHRGFPVVGEISVSIFGIKSLCNAVVMLLAL